MHATQERVDRLNYLMTQSSERLCICLFCNQKQLFLLIV